MLKPLFVTCTYVPAAETFLYGYTDPRDGREGLNEPLITGVNIFFLMLMRELLSLIELRASSCFQ